MRTYHITFRSITLAQRGERTLQRGGIGCALQRAPKQMAKNGCGYSLRIRPADAAKALELLRQDQVPFSKLYAIQDDGTSEELAL